MSKQKIIAAPSPILDLKEQNAIDTLTERYNRMIEPKKSVYLATKVSAIIPEKVKEAGGTLKTALTEEEIFTQALKVATEGFHVVEKNLSKFTISEKTIVKNVNKIMPDYEITSLNEFCLVRSYDLAKQINKNKMIDLTAAFAQGGGCGYFGIAGIPFNLVLSILLYYRAVQSIAMSYGYDIKGDSAELVIASEVFSKAMNPTASGNSEIADNLAKIMVISKGEAIKHTLSSQGWAGMASSGSVELLLLQMCALAHGAAKKALESSGKKGLEESLFVDLFKQIGQKLTQKNIQKAIPYVSAAIGALMDTSQMNKVLEFADIFYQKRFLLEKAERVNILLEQTSVLKDESVTIDIN